ncbi:L-lactate permease [Corynebacterium atypicum]|uniref:L-lactate permease n=1 Tax=Corynebacterium atypicum TaxID=191610 RepID=A0ABM5QNH1_9CORY|nr:L-lactate permease [Corynebacterium atypicum]
MRTDAVAGNVALSAVCGLLPLVAFFAFLMGLKWKAHWSAAGSVVVALLVAVFGFDMPTGLAGLSLTQGVAFGLFPIVYIIIMAVWIYDLTVASGRFEDLRRIFSRIGRGDMRVQAMLIGFAFGGLLEALAGFGAPVAIVAAMLVSIGMSPVKAAVVTLVANCAPVAFGAMAIPVTTAGTLSQLDPTQVAAMSGRLVPILALITPFLLCLIMDGMRGLRQVWPMAVVLGLSFGGGQFIASNYFTYELTDVVACLLSLACGLAFLAVWKPTTPPEAASQVDTSGVQLTGKRTALALFPYLLIVVVFAIAKLWRIGIDLPAALAKTDMVVKWPGLYGNLYTAGGDVSNLPLFNFNWLSSPGTILAGCAIITVIVYWLTSDKAEGNTLSVGHGFGELAKGVYRMRWSYLTIALVMGLAYVMNFSGQTTAIGAALAATGAIFPLLSPILGWLGTAVTGSATSSNALFAQMQSATAQQIGADQVLLVSANTAGATLGKMVSPQTAAVAAAAVRSEGSESAILKGAAKYSVGLLIVLCVVVYLQSTSVLGWMVP